MKYNIIFTTIRRRNSKICLETMDLLGNKVRRYNKDCEEDDQIARRIGAKFTKNIIHWILREKKRARRHSSAK